MTTKISPGTNLYFTRFTSFKNLILPLDFFSQQIQYFKCNFLWQKSTVRYLLLSKASLSLWSKAKNKLDPVQFTMATKISPGTNQYSTRFTSFKNLIFPLDFFSQQIQNFKCFKVSSDPRCFKLHSSRLSNECFFPHGE